MNAQRVHVGNSAQDVLECIGEPERIDKSASREVWHYQIATERGARYPYKATFENGKLKSWDFDTNAYSDRVRLREERVNSAGEPASVPFAQPNGSPPLVP